SSSNTLQACCIVSQSEVLPIMTPTLATSITLFSKVIYLSFNNKYPYCFIFVPFQNLLKTKKVYTPPFKHSLVFEYTYIEYLHMLKTFVDYTYIPLYYIF